MNFSGGNIARAAAVTPHAIRRLRHSRSRDAAAAAPHAIRRLRCSLRCNARPENFTDSSIDLPCRRAYLGRTDGDGRQKRKCNARRCSSIRPPMSEHTEHLGGADRQKLPHFGTNVSFFRKTAENFGEPRGKIPKIGKMELRIIQII